MKSKSKPVNITEGNPTVTVAYRYYTIGSHAFLKADRGSYILH